MHLLIITGTALCIPILISEGHFTKPYDHRCYIVPNEISATSCKYRRWFYVRSSMRCAHTCSKTAPFRSKRSCNGHCRSMDVCTDERGLWYCSSPAVRVYVFYPIELRCREDTSCTYYGNNFPNRDECERTCNKTIDWERNQ
uniref:Pancreatic trypsin inhibitor n=1 Tax=Rhipicephalus zambeziensis TaxID=60191 RepID=A0A224YCZ6_9ACAR